MKSEHVAVTPRKPSHPEPKAEHKPSPAEETFALFLKVRMRDLYGLKIVDTKTGGGKTTFTLSNERHIVADVDKVKSFTDKSDAVNQLKMADYANEIFSARS